MSDLVANAGPEPPSDPEDLKIITLARANRARTATAAGACVRDTDGRTYAASDVSLPHLQLSALQVAVAMAVSSGAPRLEAAALVGDRAPSPDDLAALADLPGEGVRLWCADPSGTVVAVHDV